MRTVNYQKMFDKWSFGARKEMHIFRTGVMRYGTCMENIWNII
jgi:hypothetical protein